MADTATLTVELCSHPRSRRFDALTFTIGGHPAGDRRRLCGDCGWDFGPARALDNLGQVTTELWHALDPGPGDAQMRAYAAEFSGRRALAVLARWGLSAAEYEAEFARRVSPKCAYDLGLGLSDLEEAA